MRKISHTKRTRLVIPKNRLEELDFVIKESRYDHHAKK
jgi:hypothetical protein